MVTASDTDAHKPSPEPLLLALERLGSAPDHAVYVGDAPVDVAAGKAAGVATVAVLWGVFSRAALAAAAPDFTSPRRPPSPTSASTARCAGSSP